MQQKTAQLAGIIRVLEARFAVPASSSGARTPRPTPSPPGSPPATGPGSEKPVSGLLPKGLLGLLPGGDWAFDRGGGDGGALSPTSKAINAVRPREPGGDDPASRPASRPVSFPSWGSPIPFGPAYPADVEHSESTAQKVDGTDVPDAAATTGHCRQQ